MFKWSSERKHLLQLYKYFLTNFFLDDYLYNEFGSTTTYTSDGWKVKDSSTL